jgi:hypothetical protein
MAGGIHRIHMMHRRAVAGGIYRMPLLQQLERERVGVGVVALPAPVSGVGFVLVCRHWATQSALAQVEVPRHANGCTSGRLDSSAPSRQMRQMVGSSLARTGARGAAGEGVHLAGHSRASWGLDRRHRDEQTSKFREPRQLMSGISK